MRYRMQVKVEVSKGVWDWRDVHPSGSEMLPYEYETREEAERMLYICYPRVMLPSESGARVVEVA